MTMQYKVALEFVWGRYLFRKHSMNEVFGLSILESQLLACGRISAGAADKRMLVACRNCIEMNKVV